MTGDETRRLLKTFGVAVTDGEAEAEKLVAAAASLSQGSPKEEVARLLRDASDLCRELQARWLEVTQRVALIQSNLLSQLSEAASRMQAPGTIPT